MAKRKTPIPKKVMPEKKAKRQRMEKFKDAIVPKMEAAVEPPIVASVPVEVKAARPVPCFRCSRTGDGLLCRRCGVVLGHSGQKEARLYSKPVNPTVGW